MLSIHSTAHSATALRRSRRRRGFTQSAFSSHYCEVDVDTSTIQLRCGVGLLNVTPLVRKAIQATGVRNGLVTVCSKHTTTSIVLNEDEERLFNDIQGFLLSLAPPSAAYLHNDIHERIPPPGWTEDVATWRAQEPRNAHAHLMALSLGSTESLPLVDGVLMIGTWQSLLLVELDGPRRRKVGVHVMGDS